MVETYTLEEANALIEKLKSLGNGRSLEQKLNPRGIEAFVGNDSNFIIRDLLKVTIGRQDESYHFTWGNFYAPEPLGQYLISGALKFSAWNIPGSRGYEEQVGISMVNDFKGLRVNFFPAPIPLLKSW